MLRFTQKNGFEVIAELAEWNESEDEEDWLGRVGFEKTESDSDGPTGDLAMHTLSIHKRERGEGDAYYVSYLNGEVYTAIVVPDEASLMALRIQMAPLLVANGMGWHLEEMKIIAEKAFRAWHGHAHLYPCGKCDPDGFALEKQRSEERAKRKAGGVSA
jgi:hypothetical protein